MNPNNIDSLDNIAYYSGINIWECKFDCINNLIDLCMIVRLINPCKELINIFPYLYSICNICHYYSINNHIPFYRLHRHYMYNYFYPTYTHIYYQYVIHYIHFHQSLKTGMDYSHILHHSRSKGCNYYLSYRIQPSCCKLVLQMI